MRPVNKIGHVDALTGNAAGQQENGNADFPKKLSGLKLRVPGIDGVTAWKHY